MSGTPRERLSAITHDDLPFHNPLDPARVDELIGLLGLGPDDRAVDIGCGPGELLVRLAEHTGAGGIGVDLAEEQIAEARRRAAARAPDAQLEFVAGDAGSLDLEPETFALAACVGSTHALGGLDATLDRLAELTRPGGFVLVGDGYWRRAPDPRYLAVLGATEDELPDYGGLVRAGERAGLTPVYAITSGTEEWDRYEWRLILNGERHAHEHTGETGMDDLRAWVAAARDRYLSPGGRDTLGFALVAWMK